MYRFGYKYNDTYTEGEDMGRCVRLQKMEIDHLLNVEHGSIRMACNLQQDHYAHRADVLGIYGQNGSGKTTLIHALSLLKCLLSGDSLPQEAVHYITMGAAQACMMFEFTLEDAGHKARAVYQVTLAKQDTNRLAVAEEQFKLSVQRDDGSWPALRTVAKVNMESEDILLLPRTRGKWLAECTGQSSAKLMVWKLLAFRSGGSFLFSSNLQKALTSVDNEDARQLLLLSIYGRFSLFIIGTRGWGPINMNAMIPFYFRLRNDNFLNEGSIPVNLIGPTVMRQKEYDIIRKTIEMLDCAIDKIIPNLQVELVEIGQQLLPDGSHGVAAELVSMRGGTRIPLRYEAEGIKKIVAILQILIEAYNHPMMTLAIDELDAGIFEYLLGEVLQVFQKRGKGQLIFTSHNLRPLEKLPKQSIIFTTTNPKNRYMRLKNVKANNNLRNVYFSDITLSGESEELYEQTNQYEIAHAFSKAGDLNG